MCVDEAVDLVLSTCKRSAVAPIVRQIFRRDIEGKLDLKVLITGGCGFIGRRVAARLAREHDVLCFDSLHPQIHGFNPKVELPAGVSVVRGDVTHAAELETVVRYFGPELIYHFASETGTGQSYDEPTRYCVVNVIGTTNLVEAVRRYGGKVRRIVLASSRSIYGEGACRTHDGKIVCATPRDPAVMAKGIFDVLDTDGRTLVPIATSEDLPLAPASIYASTKLAQEHILSQCFAGTPVEICVLRLQNVYGPGQSLNNPYTGIISIFTKLLMEGKALNVFEDGEIVRDFVFVGDVVEAFARAGMATKKLPGPVNIGSGQATSIKHLAETLIRLCDSRKGYTITGDYRVGDVRYAVADVERCRAEFGWVPGTPLDEGLGQFVAWAKSDLS